MKTLLTIFCGFALLMATGACAGTVTSTNEAAWQVVAVTKNKGRAPAAKAAKATGPGVNGVQEKKPSRQFSVWHQMSERHPGERPGQRAAVSPVAGVR